MHALVELRRVVKQALHGPGHGVVDEHVQPAALRHDLLSDGPNRSFVGLVEMQGPHVLPEALVLGGHRFEGGKVA